MSPGETGEQRATQAWQARKIAEALQSATGYLTQRQRLMELTGFPPNDPKYRTTVDAQRAMQSLLVDLHYRSCRGGVGRLPPK